jgi:hypothetical protein
MKNKKSAFRENEHLHENGTGCEECPLATWPDSDDITFCKSYDPTYLKFTDPLAIALLAGTLVGASLFTTIMAIFIKYINSQLVTSTSKELSFTVLIGTLLGSTGAVFFMIHPTKMMCIVRTAMFHVSICMMHAPVLVRVATIYRVFVHKTKGASQILPGK